jgi:hypothetical protein
MSGEESTSGDSTPAPDAATRRLVEVIAGTDGPSDAGDSDPEERRDAPEFARGSDADRIAERDAPSTGDALADGSPPTDDLWQATNADAESEGLPYELDVYAGMIQALLERGYEFVGFEGAIDDGQIVVRHDVDLSMERAAAMARVEADLGIVTTYCLLVTNPLYDLLAPENRAHLRTVVDCGHDVGLHFDPHYYRDEEPAVEDLEARVVADRTALEGVLDAVAADGVAVAATSIHQPPEWALGTRFDAFENAYEPRYFDAVEYVSDSAGKWRSARPFEDGVPSSMQLLVHPGLWGDDRPLREILDRRRELCHRRIEAYVGPFGG